MKVVDHIIPGDIARAREPDAALFLPGGDVEFVIGLIGEAGNDSGTSGNPDRRLAQGDPAYTIRSGLSKPLFP